ncbi:MAG TPA: peptidylprolyl isomerase [Verrucomicrobiae bacterium]|nr:peptidylprolyl isomerase [Verrucomicrobiae bacterium]
MKKILLTLFTVILGATVFPLAANTAAAADKTAGDVALVTIRINDEDQLLPVIIEFYDGDAPVTVANFKKLARKGFYNGIAFHRVFPHTLVQAGDPLSRGKDRSRVGTGGPGYTLPAEIHRKHILGAVAMSRLGDKLNPARVSSGSQFYICLKPQPNLDGQYTVFGQVTNGMENLDKISALPADSNDNPTDRAVIKSIKILPPDAAQREFERETKAKRSKFLQFFKSIQL